jgi:hypothetical protein
MEWKGTNTGMEGNDIDQQSSMLTLVVYTMIWFQYSRSLSMDVEDVSLHRERGTPFGRMGRNELGLCREV